MDTEEAEVLDCPEGFEHKNCVSANVWIRTTRPSSPIIPLHEEPSTPDLPTVAVSAAVVPPTKTAADMVSLIEAVIVQENECFIAARNSLEEQEFRLKLQVRLTQMIHEPWFSLNLPTRWEVLKQVILLLRTTRLTTPARINLIQNIFKGEKLFVFLKPCCKL